MPELDRATVLRRQFFDDFSKGLPMTVKFSQIRAFKAVYELGTVTAAANHLCVTQPAISRLIAVLEEELGFLLFERIRGKLHTTEQGKLFYHEVQRAFVGLDQLTKHGRTIRGFKGGSISVAAMPLLANLALPSVVGAMLSEAPATRFALHTFNSDEVVQRVAMQAYDVGVAQIGIANQAVRCIHFSCRVVCVFPPGEEIDLQSSAPPAFFAGRRVISNAHDHAQRLIDASMLEAGIAIDQQIEATHASTIAALVAIGAGCAITDPYTAQIARRYEPRVSIVPFSEDIPFDFYALLPRLRATAPGVQEFIERFVQFSAESGIVLKRREME